MKSKLQKIILCLFLLCCIYNLWTLRPVQILYTYSDAGSSVFLVVDHLPWTDSDKINWYLKHQNEIKNQHPLPEGSWHTWYVIDGNDSNLLIVFYVQIMPDDFVMQLHRF